MLPKTQKPTAREHRPIALTNIGCKIFMNIVKEKILEHIAQNDNEYGDFQEGFTQGRRLEENLLVGEL